MAVQDCGDRGDQPARIGVGWVRQQLIATRDLDQFAGIHDANAIGDLREQREVMGDVEHRHADAAAQI
ncbi:hypothetical protein D3C84_438950 [compost metagenome]